MNSIYDSTIYKSRMTMKNLYANTYVLTYLFLVQKKVDSGLKNNPNPHS